MSHDGSHGTAMTAMTQSDASSYPGVQPSLPPLANSPLHPLFSNSPLSQHSSVATPEPLLPPTPENEQDSSDAAPNQPIKKGGTKRKWDPTPVDEPTDPKRVPKATPKTDQTLLSKASRSVLFDAGT